MTDAANPDPDNRDADEVERHPCPRCQAQLGSPCRSRSGAVAGTYHTGRLTKVGRLSKALRVATPADRDPGQLWRPGTPPPAPLPDDTPSADIRIGYARCSTLTQELQSQLDALAAHGIARDKIFSEKISTRVRVRPQFEAALALAREIKAHAPHCRVIFTVNEMKRLGRNAAELTALADHLTAHGLVLEMLAGPLPGIYDPSGPGRILFGFFAAMAETERENIRETTLEGLDAAARKDKHGGRPAVITDDMLHTVLRRRAAGETIEQIRPDLIIPTGRRKGQNPSLAASTGPCPPTRRLGPTPTRSSRRAPNTRNSALPAPRRSSGPGPPSRSTKRCRPALLSSRRTRGPCQASTSTTSYSPADQLLSECLIPWVLSDCCFRCTSRLGWIRV
ncbi:recombinase family protein [Streptosporangium roseum]|uniref:recombinase family protein n=1 Tax=Streptosporangium roseum TaxID=2001 RepID=UPI00331F4B27